MDETPKKKRSRNLYKCFINITVRELEEKLITAPTREEKAFYRSLLNLKLQIEQEKIIGEHLL